MKKIWIIFICLCFLLLPDSQFSMSEPSDLASVSLTSTDDLKVMYTLAGESDLPPLPPGPLEPNPSPAFPPEHQLPTINHLAGQLRELELEIGARILDYCAAEKKMVMGSEGASLVGFFSTAEEQKRIEDSIGVIKTMWLDYMVGWENGYKGKPRLDQEIDDPIIIIKGNEALCYLREIFWVHALDNVLGGIDESAIGCFHSILLEKGDNSWFIMYDLFSSAYTVIPPEAPLVREGHYSSNFLMVYGFPSFEEVLGSLSTQPQWYIEALEKANQ